MLIYFLFIYCYFSYYCYFTLFADINRPVFNPMPEYNSQKIDNCCQSVNTSSSEKNLHFVASKNTEIEISSSRTSKFIPYNFVYINV